MVTVRSNQVVREDGSIDLHAWIERIKPKRAILTDMHTDMDYASLRAELPPHVEPAFDGMEFEAG